MGLTFFDSSPYLFQIKSKLLKTKKLVSEIDRPKKPTKNIRLFSFSAINLICFQIYVIVKQETAIYVINAQQCTK